MHIEIRLATYWFCTLITPASEHYTDYCAKLGGQYVVLEVIKYGQRMAVFTLFIPQGKNYIYSSFESTLALA
jgi:hypothetical protein